MNMGTATEVKDIPFGIDMRRQCFCIDENLVHTNNGSYGATPRKVLQHMRRLQEEREMLQDVFMVKNQREYWDENLRAVCDFIGAKFENTVLIPNTTTGINAVFKSLPLQPGDKILITNQTYNATKNICLEASSKVEGSGVCHIDITFPIQSTEEVVSLYRDYLDQHNNVKVAVIDLISSASALRMPLNQLIQVCKERDVIVVVDAAHSVGQVPLNVEQLGELGADFFTASLHKWLYTPKGCGVLWIHPKHHGIVRPAIVSHGYKQGLHNNFFFQGTHECIPLFCIGKAIEFYKDIGGLSTIAKYNSALVAEGAAHLVKVWGTKHLEIPKEMEAPYMRLIKLPPLNNYPPSEILQLVADIYFKYNVIGCVVQPDNGDLWVRISGQIWNTTEDYKKLGDAVLKLQAEEKQAGEPQ
ncbi:hercynylcysteine sulfoxide lyase [Lingula anatina]|uniref:Hercynylcysteine sulfoxide lyase n=1 Tax=Lingula anatina TaxID=7574 RepID=A0A1S3IJI0_LINAN|nr:hercynylcysteine sulfoxide lyase [Lingula anatina]|eukprot:XP_013398268.1 hercynylcysteine sulfoxide lyase [Lingula anatina]